MIKIFTATWCSPCKAYKEEIKDSTLPINIIDVDEQPELAAKYNVRAVPTTIFVDENSQPLKMLTGRVSNSDLEKTFKELY